MYYQDFCNIFQRKLVNDKVVLNIMKIKPSKQLLLVRVLFFFSLGSHACSLRMVRKPFVNQVLKFRMVFGAKNEAYANW